MRIGLLGGTFDPVHKGHLQLADAALKQLKLSRVYFVLSPLSPFKKKQRLTPAPLRLEMLRAALKGKSRLKVATWELERRGPSYTIETIRAYKRRHPNHQLFVIMGSDTWAGFRRWKNPQQILKLATVVVGCRPGSHDRRVTPPLPPPLTGRGIRIPAFLILNGLFPSISSTEIRASLAKGERPLRQMPAAAARVAVRRGLYGSV